MDTKNTNAKTTQSGKSAPEKIKGLELKLANFEKANHINKQLKACRAHIDTLTQMGSTSIDPNKNDSKTITLHFSGSYNDKYEIQNAVLVEDVRDFLRQKLENKTKELESQFLEIQL